MKANNNLYDYIRLCATGRTQAVHGTLAEAFLDTMPVKYAPIISKDSQALQLALDSVREKASVINPGTLQTPFENREFMRSVWEVFEREAEKRESVEFGLGFDRSAAWDYDFQASMPHKFGPANVYAIARMAGRIVAALKGQKAKKVSSVPEEVYDVELGGDPSRLLPSEMAHLGQPTELLLLDRLNDQRALIYKLRGESPAGRGPLVIAIDESGSMGGKKFKRGVWAKAAAVALTRLAWEDGRAVVWVHWSTCATTTSLIKPDQPRLLRAIRHFYGGGNDCKLALRRSAEEVKNVKRRGHKGADVVLITDGVEKWLPAHDEAIDAIEETGARLWTIGIEVDCTIEPDAPIRARAAAYTSVGSQGLEEAKVGGTAGAVL